MDRFRSFQWSISSSDSSGQQSDPRNTSQGLAERNATSSSSSLSNAGPSQVLNGAQPPLAITLFLNMYLGQKRGGVGGGRRFPRIGDRAHSSLRSPFYKWRGSWHRRRKLLLGRWLGGSGKKREISSRIFSTRISTGLDPARKPLTDYR